MSVEATYSVYGERGSIDVLAGHKSTRTILVEEVKSELTSVEQTGRKTDEKVRIAAGHLCQRRFGWTPLVTGRLLVLPDTDTARRAVRRQAMVLDAMFPARGQTVREWLRNPATDLAGIVFLSDTNPRSGNAVGGGQRASGGREAHHPEHKKLRTGGSSNRLTVTGAVNSTRIDMCAPIRVGGALRARAGS